MVKPDQNIVKKAISSISDLENELTGENSEIVKVFREWIRDNFLQ